MNGAKTSGLEGTKHLAVHGVDSSTNVELDRQAALLDQLGELAHAALADGEGLIEEDDLFDPLLLLQVLHLVHDQLGVTEAQLLAVDLGAIATVPRATAGGHHGRERLEQGEAVVLLDVDQVPCRHGVVVDAGGQGARDRKSVV